MKKPTDFQIELNFKNKIIYILTLLAFEIIITYTIIFPLDELIDKVLNVKEQRLDYKYETLVYTILLSIIIVVVLEEFIFRYFLKLNSFTSKFTTADNWHNIFPFLVYFSAIAFGLIHLSNYENNSTKFLLLSPIIVLSQLFGGLILAYIRIRLNFASALAYHSLWNILAAIILPWIQILYEGDFQSKNNSHEIVITEKLFYDKNKPRIFKIDTANQKIYKLHSEQFSIRNILDTIFEKDEYYVDDTFVNLKFESENGVTKNEFLKILKKKFDIE